MRWSLNANVMMIVHSLVLWSLNASVMMIIGDREVVSSEVVSSELMSNGIVTTCYWDNKSLNNMN